MTTDPNKAKAEELYRQGNALRKKALWAEAINAYEQAAALDADSPAVAARQMLIDIMEFRCNDYYNP